MLRLYADFLLQCAAAIITPLAVFQIWSYFFWGSYTESCGCVVTAFNAYEEGNQIYGKTLCLTHQHEYNDAIAIEKTRRSSR